MAAENVGGSLVHPKKRGCFLSHTGGFYVFCFVSDMFFWGFPGLIVVVECFMGFYSLAVCSQADFLVLWPYESIGFSAS